MRRFHVVPVFLALLFFLIVFSGCDSDSAYRRGYDDGFDFGFDAGQRAAAIEYEAAAQERYDEGYRDAWREVLSGAEGPTADTPAEGTDAASPQT